MAPNPRQPPVAESRIDPVCSRLQRLTAGLNRRTAKLGGPGKGMLLLAFLVVACCNCVFLLIRTPAIVIKTGEIVKPRNLPTDTLFSSTPVTEQEYARLKSYRLLLDSMLRYTDNTNERLELERIYPGISDSIARLERIYHLQLKNR